MARRRTRRATTRRAKPTYRTKSRSKGISSKVNPFQLDAMAYGFGRGYLSNLLKPLTQNIPLGTLSDEVGFGILNYFIAKNTKGFMRGMALKGLTIENARVGDAIANGEIGDLMPSSNGTKSNGIFLN